MNEISNYVDVQISRETARITRTGFGISMILASHFHFPDRVRTYSDPADMLSDGFITTDPHYIAALKLMGQTLSSPSFKIGRKLEDINSKATLAFTGTPSAGTWTLFVGVGSTTPIETGNITYAADDDSAVIKTAVEALAGVTEVTVTGAYSTGYVIEFTGVDAATDFRVTAIDISSLTGVTAATVTMTQYGSGVETWDTGLNAIIAEDDDWYFLEASTVTEAEIKLLSGIINTKIKMYFVSSDEADVKNGIADNTLKDLKALASDRTVYQWSGDYANYPESAWVGGQAPKNPGSLTWKFKPLTGITPDILTAAEFNNITDDNGNTYETTGGVGMISSEAVVVSGEYIDIIRGTDWLQTRMAEDLFSLLVNSDKIPFTNPGLGAIESKIRYWLNRAESADVGLLVPGESVINMPKLADISAADKLARWLKNVTFSGKYAGAVHKIEIRGKLSV